MKNSNSIVQSIRQFYKLIFAWHYKNGEATIERIIQSNLNWKRDNDYINKYISTLKKLPHPDSASIEEIYSVAREVSSGILEWNYGAKIDESLLLGDAVRKIITLYEGLEEKEEFEKSKDTTRGLLGHNMQSDKEYFISAEEAYKDIPLNSERNIGGRVAIADTNWEVQKSSRNKDSLIFRNPTELGLKAILEEEDNIFQLAFNGKIVIINIEVK